MKNKAPILVSGTCKQLLINEKIYHPLYSNGLANHLSMTLIALDKMGANKETLENFNSLYIPQLEILDQSRNIDPVSIDDALGKSHLFLNVVQFISEESRAIGIENVLSKYLDFLSPGISASAFHAIIRLSYAIEANSESDIIYSIAYIAIEYQLVSSISYKNISTSDAILLIMELKNNFQIKPTRLIVDEIKQITKNSDFHKIAFIPNDLSLDAIADIALELYLKSDNDFTLLHGVTGAHAMRIILPYFRNKEKALGHFWMAYVAMIMTTSLSSIEKQHANINRTMEECIKIGILSKDDHTIKLIYSCWQEYMYYKNNKYLMAMNMRIGSD